MSRLAVIYSSIYSLADRMSIFQLNIGMAAWPWYSLKMHRWRSASDRGRKTYDIVLIRMLSMPTCSGMSDRSQEKHFCLDYWFEHMAREKTLIISRLVFKFIEASEMVKIWSLLISVVKSNWRFIEALLNTCCRRISHWRKLISTRFGVQQRLLLWSVLTHS